MLAEDRPMKGCFIGKGPAAEAITADVRRMWDSLIMHRRQMIANSDTKFISTAPEPQFDFFLDDAFRRNILTVTDYAFVFVCPVARDSKIKIMPEFDPHKIGIIFQFTTVFEPQPCNLGDVRYVALPADNFISSAMGFMRLYLRRELVFGGTVGLDVADIREATAAGTVRHIKFSASTPSLDDFRFFLDAHAAIQGCISTLHAFISVREEVGYVDHISTYANRLADRCRDDCSFYFSDHCLRYSDPDGNTACEIDIIC